MNTKKRFRLFISSTFSDFKREREVLQTQVFPEIERYCSDKGFIFQPIDLRWGISNEAQLDQKTLDLCLKEVNACKAHPHPNFIVMLGDRYGWVPLPHSIKKEEFEALVACADKANITSQQIKHLKDWYILDNNQVPASYRLVERYQRCKAYEEWQPEEDKLRDIVQRLALKALDQKTISSKQKNAYFTSATEAEINEGLFSNQKNAEHVFGFFRSIETTNEEETDFIDSAKNRVKADTLKQKVADAIPPEHTLTVTTTQKSDKALNKKLNEDYLESFKTSVIHFLKQQIDQSQQQQTSLTPLQYEIKAHEQYAQTKRHGFIGQKNLLKTIQNYINSDTTNNQQTPPQTNSALVVYGASGMGKSSLMAQAIEQTEQNQKNVHYRFVGATPHSSSTVEVLSSLFEQLGINIKPKSNHSENKQKDDAFEEFCKRVHNALLSIKSPCVIFIDAVDQLMNDDKFLWLPQQLPSMVKIIISALDDEHYETDSGYFKALKQRTDHCHAMPPFTKENGLTLLNAILKEQNRTLQTEQKNYFKQQFQTSPTPLYALIASHELKTWKSHDAIATKQKPRDKSLATTQQGIIKEFISNLHTLHHHHKGFVSRVLGYLLASKDGLSEHELLDLLATDEAFIKEIAPETFHKNSNKKLPFVHWSRLQTVLQPFLSIKNQDDEALMSFFHREFNDVIREWPNQCATHEELIKATQQLIEQARTQAFSANRWGKLYLILIVEYQLTYEDKQKTRGFSEFIVNSALLKEVWISDFLTYAAEVRSKQYLNISLYVLLEILYKKNSQFWITMLSSQLSMILTGFKALVFISSYNRYDDSINLIKEILDVIKPFYQGGRAIQFIEGLLTGVVRSYLELQFIRVLTETMRGLGSLYEKQNELDSSIKYQEEALQIIKPLYLEDPKEWTLDYTDTISCLGDLYKDLNDIDKGTMCIEEAWQIGKELFDENSKQWGWYLDNAGRGLLYFYEKQDDIDKSIKFIKEYLQIRKQINLYMDKDGCYFPVDLLIIVERLVKLTKLDVEKSSTVDVDEVGFYKTLECQKEVLQIIKEFYQEDPKVLGNLLFRTIDNFSGSYVNQMSSDKALKIQKEALQIIRPLYREDPKEWGYLLFRTIDNLAGSYEDQSEYDKAIKIQKEVLQIIRPLYLEDPKKWAGRLISKIGDLSYLYEYKEEYDKSIKYQEEAWQLIKLLFQENPQQLVSKLNHEIYRFEELYEAQDEFYKVIRLKKEILQLIRPLYLKEPKEWGDQLSCIIDGLTMVYQKLGDVDEGKKLNKEVFQIIKPLHQKYPGQWVKQLTCTIDDLVESYDSQNELDKAIIFKKEALQIIKQVFPEGPQQWAKELSHRTVDLSDSYEGQNKFDKAMKLKEEAFQIFKPLYQDDPKQWSESIKLIFNSLSTLYQQQGREEDCESLVQELKQMGIIE